MIAVQHVTVEIVRVSTVFLISGVFFSEDKVLKFYQLREYTEKNVRL